MTTETECFSEYSPTHSPSDLWGRNCVQFFSSNIQKLLRLKVTVHLSGAAIVCSDPVVAREAENLTCTEDLTAVCSWAILKCSKLFHPRLPLARTALQPLPIYSVPQEGSRSHCPLTLSATVEWQMLASGEK